MVTRELDLCDPAAVTAEAERRAKLRAQGETTFSAPAVLLEDVDEDAIEDAHVTEGDRVMRSLGFEVVSFSQKKRAKVTKGIPDRRYYHRRRQLALWWEAKSATGRQRPDQRLFQEMCEACNEPYVLGTHEALIGWLTTQGIARMVGNTLEPMREP